MTLGDQGSRWRMRSIVRASIATWRWAAAFVVLGTAWASAEDKPVLVHHPVATREASAQALFDRGLTAYYAYNHPQAVRLFRAAAAADPHCAMAFWGIALAAGPTLNETMTPQHLVLARGALHRARTLATEPAERAYVEALSVRYLGRKVDEVGWGLALRRMMGRFVDDLDLPTLYAESKLNRYGAAGAWQRDGRPAHGVEDAVPLLEEVLRRNPLHFGAGHFLIHLTEASPSRTIARPVSDRMALASVLPEDQHFVHMPSHVFDHSGDYPAAVAANERAVELVAAYMAEGVPPRAFADVDYSHNLRFLMRMAVFAGLGEQAVTAGRRYQAELGSTAPLLIVLAELGRWEEVLRTPRPKGRDMMMGRPEVVDSYARGMAYAQLGQIGRARAMLARLPTHEQARTADDRQESIARGVLEGTIALRQGDGGRGVVALEKAVADEDSLPYSELPYWWFPVRELLGAALSAQGRLDEAAAVFRADLARHPGSAVSMQGLAEAEDRRLRR